LKLCALEIEGAWLAEFPVFVDQRGFFREWFKAELFENPLEKVFKVEQANISSSTKGTVRGIHYSLAAKGQAKWVTCVSGSTLT
jgi:dTDP-4-dehydrorhamnose 3,5-epimerase